MTPITIRLIAFLMLISLASLLSGCSGGGAGGAATPGTGISYGKLVLVFPPPGEGKAATAAGSPQGEAVRILKAIPAGTASFIVALRDGSNADVVPPVTVTYTAGQASATAVIENIVPGTYSVVIRALDSGGIVLGSGTSSVTVAAGQTSSVSVTVTPSASSTKMYVVNSGDRTISIIDMTTDTVTGTFSIDTTGSLGDVEFNVSGTRAIVSNYSDNLAHIIDTAANSELGAPGTGPQPGPVVFRPSPTGSTTGYIMNGTSTPGKLDLTTLTVANLPNVPLGVGAATFTRDGALAFFGGTTASVVKYDRVAENWMQVKLLGSTGDMASSLVFNRTETRLYAAMNVVAGNGWVGVLDPADLTSGTVAPYSITVGPNPVHMVILPDDSKLYVANKGNNTVTVIDVVAWTATTIPAGFPGCTRLAVSPDGAKVYVVNNAGNTVSVVRTSNDTVIRTIAVGSAPTGIAVMP